MSEDRAPYDVDTLKQIASNDQRSQSEKDHDRAVIRCAEFTAAHWKFLTGQGLPEHLVDRLTVAFQESYLQALFAPAFSFLMDTGDDDE